MTGLEMLLNGPDPFITDGGIETDLIFNDGFDLPYFSSFVLLSSEDGRTGLERYFDRYLDLAERTGRGFVLDTATWRANAGWAGAHGLSEKDMRSINREAVRFAHALRARRDWSDRILVNGSIGPAGDGYAPDQLFEPDAAEAIHRPQIEALAEAGADLAMALTMTHPGEAIGVVRAAHAAGLPIAISFTVETDGQLPVGSSLADAIAEVEVATNGAPIFYGVNCAHPTHFLDRLDGDWTRRIGVVRANASALSHAELDEAVELDDGDPDDFGRLYGELSARLPNLHLVGGCCGSDCRHVHAAMSAL
ncbi:homocysteine S-methyltransferase family protein [Albidovulum sediminicola]|uniref:Homocysteine S-methyltransferase family protein n=1 Tax=Albidovulum sediminicola TaxID=2984331 RepID=A0ABT2Z3L9_9RHOB|nr:homocysteine S-methyltransferase family protein [Defluviimonas sp. WL0075]MCV2865744.1 homocysteine S-methyltransferase family protein [Defluviimonas sp. WL0075]